MADYDIGAGKALKDVNGNNVHLSLISFVVNGIEFEELNTIMPLPNITTNYDNFINKGKFLYYNDGYSMGDPIIAPTDANILFDLGNDEYFGYILVCDSRDRDVMTPPVNASVPDYWYYNFMAFNYKGEVTEDNPNGFQYDIEFSGAQHISFRDLSDKLRDDNQYYIVPSIRVGTEPIQITCNIREKYTESIVPYTELELNTRYKSVSGYYNDIYIYRYNGDSVTEDNLPTEPDSSSTGGGGGTYDLSSDTIDFPDLPSLSASNSGLIALYNPSISQLMALSDWLWSKSLLDTLEKMYAQPMDLIVSLNIVPVAPTHFDGVQAIKIGGVDTDVSAQKLSSQYEVFDCGYIDVPEYYGSAMDYGQYTRVSLYLPFCNVVELKTDEIMGGRVHVKYYIDMFNGSCVAMVKCTRQNLDAVLYSFEGNVAVNLPVTSTDFSNMYNAIIKGGVNAIQSGNPISGAVDTALNVMFSKPNVQRSGSVSSSGGLLGLKKPYLIIERAIQSLPSNYAQNYGYPSNITDYLYNLNGYTEIESVITNNLRCTQVEQDEIINLLKEGVII